jgi:hypothetical protein
MARLYGRVPGFLREVSLVILRADTNLDQSVQIVETVQTVEAVEVVESFYIVRGVIRYLLYVIRKRSAYDSLFSDF